MKINGKTVYAYDVIYPLNKDVYNSIYSIISEELNNGKDIYIEFYNGNSISIKHVLFTTENALELLNSHLYKLPDSIAMAFYSYIYNEKPEICEYIKDNNISIGYVGYFNKVINTYKLMEIYEYVYKNIAPLVYKTELTDDEVKIAFNKEFMQKVIETEKYTYEGFHPKYSSSDILHAESMNAELAKIFKLINGSSTDYNITMLSLTEFYLRVLDNDNVKKEIGIDVPAAIIEDDNYRYNNISSDIYKLYAKKHKLKERILNIVLRNDPDDDIYKQATDSIDSVSKLVEYIDCFKGAKRDDLLSEEVYNRLNLNYSFDVYKFIYNRYRNTYSYRNHVNTFMYPYAVFRYQMMIDASENKAAVELYKKYIDHICSISGNSKDNEISILASNLAQCIINKDLSLELTSMISNSNMKSKTIKILFDRILRYEKNILGLNACDYINAIEELPYCRNAIKDALVEALI